MTVYLVDFSVADKQRSVAVKKLKGEPAEATKE